MSEKTGAIRARIELITNEHPLDGEHPTDARYVWPERWKAVLELADELDAAKEPPNAPQT